MSRHALVPLAMAVSLASAFACGPRTKSGSGVNPPMPAHTAARCAESGQSAPLIVEWPSAERTKLESRARAGLVLLRYKGCNIEVLAHCATAGSYAWVGTTRKRDHLVLSDRDELYANVPLGAASLEGKLARTGSLDVDITMVGRFESSRGAVRRDEVSGDGCDEATHVVTGITVGAFRFSTGVSGKAGASAGAFGAKAGGETASSRETLALDGDAVACADAKSGSIAPPPQCAAPLRIELVPLGKEKKAAPDCAKGTAWDGTKCRETTAPGCTTADDALSACSAQCATTDATACVALGIIYERRKELAFATAAYTKACDRGVGEGCAALAGLYLDGEAMPKDPARATTLFERGCDLHHAESCTWLGHLHRLGIAPGADAARSTNGYTRGCDSGDAFACYWLADAHLEGRGTPKDQGRALLILRRLCGEKHALSCLRLKSLGES